MSVRHTGVMSGQQQWSTTPTMMMHGGHCESDYTTRNMNNYFNSFSLVIFPYSLSFSLPNLFSWSGVFALAAKTTVNLCPFASSAAPYAIGGSSNIYVGTACTISVRFTITVVSMTTTRADVQAAVAAAVATATANGESTADAELAAKEEKTTEVKLTRGTVSASLSNAIIFTLPAASASETRGPLRVTIEDMTFVQNGVLGVFGVLPPNSTLFIRRNTFTFTARPNQFPSFSRINAVYTHFYYSAVTLSNAVPASNTEEAGLVPWRIATNNSRIAIEDIQMKVTFTSSLTDIYLKWAGVMFFHAGGFIDSDSSNNNDSNTTNTKSEPRLLIRNVVITDSNVYPTGAVSAVYFYASFDANVLLLSSPSTSGESLSSPLLLVEGNWVRKTVTSAQPINAVEVGGTVTILSAPSSSSVTMSCTRRFSCMTDIVDTANENKKDVSSLSYFNGNASGTNVVRASALFSNNTVNACRIDGASGSIRAVLFLHIVTVEGALASLLFYRNGVVDSACPFSASIVNLAYRLFVRKGGSLCAAHNFYSRIPSVGVGINDKSSFIGIGFGIATIENEYMHIPLLNSSVRTTTNCDTEAVVFGTRATNGLFAAARSVSLGNINVKSSCMSTAGDTTATLPLPLPRAIFFVGKNSIVGCSIVGTRSTDFGLAIYISGEVNIESSISPLFSSSATSTNKNQSATSALILIGNSLESTTAIQSIFVVYFYDPVVAVVGPLSRLGLVGNAANGTSSTSQGDLLVIRLNAFYVLDGGVLSVVGNIASAGVKCSTLSSSTTAGRFSVVAVASLGNDAPLQSSFSVGGRSVGVEGPRVIGRNSHFVVANNTAHGVSCPQFTLIHIECLVPFSQSLTAGRAALVIEPNASFSIFGNTAVNITAVSPIRVALLGAISSPLVLLIRGGALISIVQPARIATSATGLIVGGGGEIIMQGEGSRFYIAENALCQPSVQSSVCSQKYLELGLPELGGSSSSATIRPFTSELMMAAININVSAIVFQVNASSSSSLQAGGRGGGLSDDDAYAFLYPAALDAMKKGNTFSKFASKITVGIPQFSIERNTIDVAISLPSPSSAGGAATATISVGASIVFERVPTAQLRVDEPSTRTPWWEGDKEKESDFKALLKQAVIGNDLSTSRLVWDYHLQLMRKKYQVESSSNSRPSSFFVFDRNQQLSLFSISENEIKLDAGGGGGGYGWACPPAPIYGGDVIASVLDALPSLLSTATINENSIDVRHAARAASDFPTLASRPTCLSMAYAYEAKPIKPAPRLSPLAASAIVVTRVDNLRSLYIVGNVVTQHNVSLVNMTSLANLSTMYLSPMNTQTAAADVAAATRPRNVTVPSICQLLSIVNVLDTLSIPVNGSFSINDNTAFLGLTSAAHDAYTKELVSQSSAAASSNDSSPLLLLVPPAPFALLSVGHNITMSILSGDEAVYNNSGTSRTHTRGISVTNNTVIRLRPAAAGVSPGTTSQSLPLPLPPRTKTHVWPLTFQYISTNHTTTVSRVRVFGGTQQQQNAPPTKWSDLEIMKRRDPEPKQFTLNFNVHVPSGSDPNAGSSSERWSRAAAVTLCGNAPYFEDGNLSSSSLSSFWDSNMLNRSGAEVLLPYVLPSHFIKNGFNTTATVDNQTCTVLMVLGNEEKETLPPRHTSTNTQTLKTAPQATLSLTTSKTKKSLSLARSRSSTRALSLTLTHQTITFTGVISFSARSTPAIRSSPSSALVSATQSSLPLEETTSWISASTSTNSTSFASHQLSWSSSALPPNKVYTASSSSSSSSSSGGGPQITSTITNTINPNISKNKFTISFDYHFSSSASSSILPYTNNSTRTPSITLSQRIKRVVSSNTSSVASLPPAVSIAGDLADVTAVAIVATSVISTLGRELGVANAIVRIAKCDDDDGEGGEDDNNGNSNSDFSGPLPLLVHPLRFSIFSGQFLSVASLHVSTSGGASADGSSSISSSTDAGNENKNTISESSDHINNDAATVSEINALIDELGAYAGAAVSNVIILPITLLSLSCFLSLIKEEVFHKRILVRGGVGGSSIVNIKRALRKVTAALPSAILVPFCSFGEGIGVSVAKMWVLIHRYYYYYYYNYERFSNSHHYNNSQSDANRQSFGLANSSLAAEENEISFVIERGLPQPFLVFSIAVLTTIITLSVLFWWLWILCVRMPRPRLHLIKPLKTEGRNKRNKHLVFDIHAPSSFHGNSNELDTFPLFMDDEEKKEMSVTDNDDGLDADKDLLSLTSVGKKSSSSHRSSNHSLSADSSLASILVLSTTITPPSPSLPHSLVSPPLQPSSTTADDSITLLPPLIAQTLSPSSSSSITARPPQAVASDERHKMPLLSLSLLRGKTNTSAAAAAVTNMRRRSRTYDFSRQRGGAGGGMCRGILAFCRHLTFDEVMEWLFEPWREWSVRVPITDDDDKNSINEDADDGQRAKGKIVRKSDQEQKGEAEMTGKDDKSIALLLPTAAAGKVNNDQSSSPTSSSHQQKKQQEQQIQSERKLIEKYLEKLGGDALGDKRFYYCEVIAFICALVVGFAEALPPPYYPSYLYSQNDSRGRDDVISNTTTNTNNNNNANNLFLLENNRTTNNDNSTPPATLSSAAVHAEEGSTTTTTTNFGATCGVKMALAALAAFIQCFCNCMVLVRFDLFIEGCISICTISITLMATARILFADGGGNGGGGRAACDLASNRSNISSSFLCGSSSSSGSNKGGGGGMNNFDFFDDDSIIKNFYENTMSGRIDHGLAVMSIIVNLFSLVALLVCVVNLFISMWGGGRDDAKEEIDDDDGVEGLEEEI